MTFRTAFLIGLGIFLSATPARSASLQLKQVIPLSGVEGRIDHLDIDLHRERLFACALGSNAVEVIDLRRAQRIQSIPSLGFPQGIAYLASSDRLFVANDSGGLCRIFDAKTFQPVAELSLKDDADNVRYDATAQRIYVGFGDGGLAIIDATTGKRLGSVALAAHPEAFALERHGRRIFVNVPKAGHVAVIDRQRGEIIATWKTGAASDNYPMALDEANHRLFLGCRKPATLVVLNTETGAVATSLPISGDPDDLFYDQARKSLYVISGAGSIDLIAQIDPDTYRLAKKVSTASGARTGLFVPERSMLYLAVPHRDPQPAEIKCYQVER